MNRSEVVFEVFHTAEEKKITSSIPSSTVIYEIKLKSVELIQTKTFDAYSL